MSRKPTPPCAVIGVPDSITYGQTMGLDALTEMVIPILVLVPMTSERTAWARLEQYLAPTGNKSIRRALHGARENRTLNASISYLRVTEVTQIGVQLIGETDYLAAEVRVNIMVGA